jgi:phospholipid transport system transporter-binding protein
MIGTRDKGAPSAALVAVGDDRLHVEGVVDFSTVTRLYSDSQVRFVAGRRLVIDLDGVSGANSAALALLLEWMELAHTRGTKLKLQNLPAGVLSIAALSGLDVLLPVDDLAPLDGADQPLDAASAPVPDRADYTPTGG